MILAGQDNGRWKSLDTIRKERAAKEAKLKLQKGYKPKQLSPEELAAKLEFEAE